jgi:MFS family permease
VIARTSLLGLTLALVLLPSNLPAAVLPLLQGEWQAGGLAAGWVVAAYQVGYLLSAAVLLPLTDRLPAQRVIGGSALAAAVAALLFPVLAGDVWSAALLRIVAGLGLAGVYMPGVRVVAATATPERRGFAVGAYVSAFYLGSALSLWFTGLLLPALGWRGVGGVLGLVALIGLPLALLGTRSLSPPKGGRAHLDPGVLRHAPVRQIIMAYTGHSFELYTSRGWLAAFLISLLVAQGLPTAAATAEGSQWAALMSGLGTAGVWLGGWLSDRLDRRRSALLVALSSGLLSLLFGWLGLAPWPLLLAIGCLYGLLQSADSAIYSTAITELAPPGRLGSAQALQALIGFGATVLAPLAGGLMLDLGFGWPGVFLLAGLVGILLALPLLAADQPAAARP